MPVTKPQTANYAGNVRAHAVRVRLPVFAESVISVPKGANVNLVESVIAKARRGFRESGMDDYQIQQAEAEIRRRMSEEPDPRIALIGFTGVGKSSTINSLFNAGHEIGHVRACTQEAKEVRGEVSEYTGSKGSVIVYDMPGLGEDLWADQRHLRTYAAVLPRVDVAVWTFHAGDRAMTPMQNALMTLQKEIGPGFVNRLVFAINKADKTEPGETAWNDRLNVPSPEQRAHMQDFEANVLEKVRQVLPSWQGQIVSYSAKKRYRLELLMTAMVSAASSSRKWLLEQRADVVDYLEGVDPSVVEFVRAHGAELGEPGSRPWRRG